ncbi:MAG: cyclopropane-fatty-acyl-phospholipid synthase [Verrucomicrobiales bacterium]|jgi:cyclopropane-fatty-acyl-phospholipid synthase
MNTPDRLWLTALGSFASVSAVTIELPDGSTHTVGPGRTSAQMSIVDRSIYANVVREGALGFVEAYLDGQIETDDVRALFSWAATNHAAASQGAVRTALAPVQSIWQRVVPARKHPKVETMVDHYNLGNEFYGTWLDRSMTYSCARFSSPEMSLVDAQLHKYETIADHAGLQPGMRVLDIGCGWGGFARYAAAERDVDVVGVTIANEQAEYARKSIADFGLSDRVDIRLEDFRELDGEWDAIVSIEMIESIDQALWPTLFDSFARLGTPDARVVMQSITIADDRFAGYARRQDFIQRYIFPGGQLPSNRVIRGLAAGSGLRIEAIEDFGTDYAKTLTTWFDRFEATWPELEKMGFDERFRRMWLTYLAYCEGGFRSGEISVGQWVFSASPTS